MSSASARVPTAPPLTCLSARPSISACSTRISPSSVSAISASSARPRRSSSIRRSGSTERSTTGRSCMATMRPKTISIRSCSTNPAINKLPQARGSVGRTAVRKDAFFIYRIRKASFRAATTRKSRTNYCPRTVKTVVFCRLFGGDMIY